LLRVAVEANVRWTMKTLRESPEGGARLATGVIRLVGAVYELGTGRVRFLED
jgi:carbonic anhydrase